MARIPPPDATVPGAREFGILAHAPAILDAFRRLYGGLWQAGAVDHPTKEVVRLRNARITDCGY